jgi:hypothetical protein
MKMAGTGAGRVLEMFLDGHSGSIKCRKFLG